MCVLNNLVGLTHFLIRYSLYFNPLIYISNFSQLVDLLAVLPGDRWEIDVSFGSKMEDVKFLFIQNDNETKLSACKLS